MNMTAGKRKNAIAHFLLISYVVGVLLIECPVYAGEIVEPVGLHSLCAVLMDAQSGRILYGKDADTARPMASTTKILTCILALEHGNLEEEVTVSANAQVQPQVKLGMREGESYRLGDLLYSLMLESHNDTAVAIAEHLSGSTEKFADLMNEKAREIGCTNAHFVTPNGLDGADAGGVHSITASDLAKIMRYCVMISPKKEEFLKITQTPSCVIADAKQSRTFSCTNHNALFSMMDGVLSGKTGFTGDAGYCYVCAVENEGRTFVVALLGCGWPNHKTYKWQDTKQLIEYGTTYFHYQSLQPNGRSFEIPVENGMGEGLFDEEKAEVRIKNTTGPVKVLVRDDQKIQAELMVPEQLNAPIRKGAFIGTLAVRVGEERICEYPVEVVNGVEERSFGRLLNILFREWIRLERLCNIKIDQ